jgi:putative transposase
MVTPVARREAVVHLRSTFEVSERRACSALGTDRTSVRYRSTRPDDAAIRVRLRELAAQRRRFGYRRLHILLTREGLVMNHKKLRRLYREERLAVCRRGSRKRALGTRAPMAIPQGANQRWSLDFLSDAFTDGRRFRILAIVDDFTRECLALVTASHELFEMVIDPIANMWAEATRGREFAYEMCDAVEEDTFLVDGLQMSNFVYPTWFEPFKHPRGTKFDHLGLLKAPFTMTSGGYVIVKQRGKVKERFRSKAKKKRFANETRRGHRSEYRKRDGLRIKPTRKRA